GNLLNDLPEKSLNLPLNHPTSNPREVPRVRILHPSQEQERDPSNPRRHLACHHICNLGSLNRVNLNKRHKSGSKSHLPPRSLLEMKGTMTKRPTFHPRSLRAELITYYRFPGKNSQRKSRGRRPRTNAG